MLRPIEIIGGGLAGLALGIALRRDGVPVTVVEAGSYPRHRTCGEFINGLDEDLVARLGLADTIRAAPRRDRVSWLHRGAGVRRWRLVRPAVVISRGELDHRLASEFNRRGGTLVTGTAAPLREQVAGRVFATGRRPTTRSRWLGLKEHVANLPLDGDLEFHVGHRGYVGLCALEGGVVNVCGLFRRDAGVRSRPATGLEPHLRAAGLDRLADRLAAATREPRTFCAVAGLQCGRQEAPRDCPALGDAYAVMPPYTGQGMALAFASAAAAWAPLVAWSRQAVTWTTAVVEIQRRHARLFGRRLRRAAILHPFLLTPAPVRIAALGQRCGLVPLRALSRVIR